MEGDAGMEDDLFMATWSEDEAFPPSSDGGALPSGPDLRLDPTMPLAARMRPRDLDEYAGQGHILGEGRLLRRAIEADRFTSLTFMVLRAWGKRASPSSSPAAPSRAS